MAMCIDQLLFFHAVVRHDHVGDSKSVFLQQEAVASCAQLCW